MKKNFIKGMLGVFLLTGLVSCNKDDDSVFDQTVTERLTAQEAELREALESSEYGWKLVYFTDETKLGGFTFLFDFVDGKNVRMVSDFNAEGLIEKTSEYEIHLRSTTSLVFVTENHIHKLSDGALSYVEPGKGYKGDFQFRYYGSTEDEILFKTTRSFEDLKFVKATAEDWANFNKGFEMEGKFNDLNKPVFKSLTIEDGSGVTGYDMDYNSATRYAKLSGSNGEVLNENGGVGIGFSPNGLVVQPAVEVDGESVTEFEYKSATSTFEYLGANGSKAVIKLESSPYGNTDAYKKFLAGKPSVRLFMSTDREQRIIGADGNSMLFFDYIQKNYNEGGAGAPLNIASIDMYFNNNGNRLVIAMSDGASYRYNFTTSDGNGAIKMNFTTATPASGRNADVDEFAFLILNDPVGMFYKETTDIHYYGDVYVSRLMMGSSPLTFMMWDLSRIV